MVVLWAVPIGAALFAVRRLLQARRTRRQTIDALALVPEWAGVVPVGTGDRAAAWAARLVREMGGDPIRVATAARLHGLHPAVFTQSGICPGIAALVRDATNAPRGQAWGEAAVVRVAHGFAAGLGEDGSQPSGALFRTVVAHPEGDERRAARVLVNLVQGGSPSA